MTDTGLIPGTIHEYVVIVLFADACTEKMSAVKSLAESLKRKWEEVNNSSEKWENELDESLEVSYFFHCILT